jgi:uracil-DNA glycosylase
MFTGDESGTWLFRALHEAGFASQAASVGRHDGMRLSNCYITAAVHCAPPQNRPTYREVEACRKFLLEELSLLRNVRVVVGLGRLGFETVLGAYRALGRLSFARIPAFGHGAVYRYRGLTVIASFHPSQQNTFTGRLTRRMLAGVFAVARRELAVVEEGLDRSRAAVEGAWPVPSRRA